MFQVSVNGLEVLCLMVDRMGEEFKPHITTGSYPPLIPPDLLVCFNCYVYGREQVMQTQIMQSYITNRFSGPKDIVCCLLCFT